MEATGRMTGKSDCCIVQPFKAFCCLHSAVFMAHALSLETKRSVYCSVVLEVLFYGAEQVLVRELKWLRHCCCVHCTCTCIMGVGRVVAI